jgi:hypothetical protein
MKRRDLLKNGAITSVLLAAAIAHGTAAAASQTTPLVINAAILEVTGPTPRCQSGFGGTITGQGDSPQLGRVVLIATDCITQVGTSFNFSDGKLIIMNAGGDQIFANYSGQFVPTGNGPEFVFSGATFQITGGTGRYAKASGGGSLQGGENIVTGVGTMKASGTISYKDKDKSYGGRD